MNMGAKV